MMARDFKERDDWKVIAGLIVSLALLGVAMVGFVILPISSDGPIEAVSP